MGQPAARMGDNTAHGGVIVKGEPTVLIGGKPAARVSDMHTCPMQTPATPPIPHVGGPILPPGAPTVLIKGLPAARVGDMCVCTGPPDSIVMGCTTVLIGSGGGGGGAGAGGGKGAGKGEAKAKEGDEGKAEDSDAQSDDAEAKETHKLDVSFEDKSGFPITGVGITVKDPDSKTDEGVLFGRVRKFGVKDGDHEISVKAISDARWSTDQAKVGDKVKLQVKTVGIDNDEPLGLDIFIKDANAPDYLLATIESQVKSDKVEEEWELVIDDAWLEAQDKKRDRKRYSMPHFYFVARSGGIRQRSGLLRYNDWIDIDLEDDDGKKLGNQTYRLHLASGEVREGKLDGNGHAREENVPPGRCGVEFPELYGQSDTQSRETD